jgi:hypothetical protein
MKRSEQIENQGLFQPVSKWGLLQTRTLCFEDQLLFWLFLDGSGFVMRRR